MTEIGAGQLCSSCGAEPVVRGAGKLTWRGPCWACGRVETHHQPFYGVETVEYDFDESSASERANATDLLVGAGIAYRWDSGFRLQVSPDREDDVDVLFGHTPDEADEGEREDVDQQQAADGQGEPAGWLADERSVGALADLFTIADRLRHHPADKSAAAELRGATDLVNASPVPFAMNRMLWQNAQYLARQLMGLVDAAADSDDIVTSAGSLRALLRDHV